MMNKLKLVLGLILLVALAACEAEPEYLTTEYGIKYRFIRQSEDGKKPELGDVMSLNMNHLIGDSMTFESNAASGFFLNPHTGVAPSLRSVLKECAEGDSVEIVMSIQEYAQITRFPTAGIDTTEVVKWNLGVKKVENEQAMRERAQAEQLAIDDKIIEEYLVNNNLEAERTPEGVYYIVLQEGDGTFPEEGNNVFVNYTVRLLDGTLIDTSNEDLAKDNDMYNPGRQYGPLSFALGRPGIIQGWNIGIPNFSKGGSGYLIVPSSYAYGSRGSGSVAPNSVLIFDIEVVDF